MWTKDLIVLSISFDDDDEEKESLSSTAEWLNVRGNVSHDNNCNVSLASADNRK